MIYRFLDHPRCSPDILPHKAHILHNLGLGLHLAHTPASGRCGWWAAGSSRSCISCRSVDYGKPHSCLGRAGRCAPLQGSGLLGSSVDIPPGTRSAPGHVCLLHRRCSWKAHFLGILGKCGGMDGIGCQIQISVKDSSKRSDRYQKSLWRGS